MKPNLDLAHPEELPVADSAVEWAPAVVVPVPVPVLVTAAAAAVATSTPVECPVLVADVLKSTSTTFV